MFIGRNRLPACDFGGRRLYSGSGNNRKLSQTGLITTVASELQVKNRPGIMSQWQAKQSFHCAVESIEFDDEVHRRERRILHDVLRFADHMRALHVYSNETTGDTRRMPASVHGDH
jgi:hypothetical protein